MTDLKALITTEVAIVGAGPCGATVANFLGEYGVRTVLIDRAANIIDYPRAIGMDDECLRSFQGIGLADDIISDVIQNVPLRFIDGRGRCFADIRPDTKEFGWFRRNIFMQPLAEATLRKGLDRYPHVQVLLNREVTGLSQDDSGVTLSIRAPDGTTFEVRAQFVVAADGGRSPIREMLGIPLDGDTHPHKWVVIDAANDPLNAPYTALHCDPARPYVCAHMPYDYRRWEFMLFPGEDENEMLRPEKVRELLARHVTDPDAVDVIRARVYTHHSRLAANFLVGRVALAGDAAHLMPPWAGQGMNTGIRDATNLAWKLAAIVQGRAAPEIMRTYESERRDHAKAMIDLSTTLGRILSPTHRWAAHIRDGLFRVANLAPGVKQWVLQMKFKPMPRYLDGVVVHTDRQDRGSPVGRMFIQPLVEMEDGSVHQLDDVLGPWFAVLGFETDPAAHLTTAQKQLLDRAGARYLKVVESRPGAAFHEVSHREAETLVIEDRENQLRHWFSKHPGKNVVVLRPDRYVGALCAPDDLGWTVEQIAGILGVKECSA